MRTVRLINGDALRRKVKRESNPYGKPSIDFESGKRVIELIDSQPTIQPEPHWIPVTEDTPIEDGDYWCTFGAETGWFVDWCSWYHGRWVVWLNDIPNDVSNVIAWCKPFEPYKVVTE